MKFHLYRLERNLGGQLCLFVDEGLTPAIAFEERSMNYPPHTGGGNPRVEIGHLESGILTVSDIQIVSFCVSDGYDVSCKPVISEEGLLRRFNTGTNVLVEVENL
jgi:hypothetical protein